jgi:hypothetical protein
VVLDEAQFIADSTRGINVELLLTNLIAARERGVKPQIVTLSAVIGGTNHIDEWLDCDDKARPSAITDWLYVLRQIAKNNTNIITQADRTLLEPDPHRSVAAFPSSGSPVDLLPISIFVSNVAGGIPGSKPCVPDPALDVLAELIADGGTYQPLIDSATQVEVSRLSIYPVAPTAALIIALKCVRRRKRDPGPGVVFSSRSRGWECKKTDHREKVSKNIKDSESRFCSVLHEIQKSSPLFMDYAAADIP